FFSVADDLCSLRDDSVSVDGNTNNKSRLGGVSESITSGRLPYRDLQHLYEELNDKFRKLSNEKDELALIAQQRQQAFLRTEEKYAEDMRLLEVRLQRMGLEEKSRMEPIRNLHGNIQDTINSIQNKTARV